MLAGGTPELIYFDGPGRAHQTRLAFQLGGVEYKDTRIPMADWPAVKGDPNSAPGQAFGSMPVVVRGPVLLAQSSATAQYASDLAMSQAGVNPTAQQRALDMMMLGALADAQSAMYACLFGDDESKAKGKEQLGGKITPLLTGIERQYKGDSVFLYSSGPTLGDLAVYNIVESPFPGLKALGLDLSPFKKITATSDAVKAALEAGEKPKSAEGPEASGKSELIYFGAPGRGELARLAFAAGGVEFTDTRLTFQEWPGVKQDPESVPAKMFGSMPVIKHGDFLVAQSISISQYAADLGINAATPPSAEQRGLDTMMLGAHADLQSAMYACLFGDDESKAKGKEQLAGKVTPILEGIERQYTRQPSPFLYAEESQGPSLGDLALLDVVTSPFPGLKALGIDLSPFPKVVGCVEACQKSTKGTLAAYLQSR